MILIRKKFQVVFFSMFLSLISSGCIRYESGSARGLLLWNKLGSRREVLNSQVGPGGQVNAGRFVEGRFGRGVELNMQEAFGVTFPLDAVPTSAGCIEFWAKLVDFPQSLPWFKDPGLIGLGDENTDPLLRFNLNDGISDGGLCVRLPGIGSAGTGLFGAWTYARALGTTAENVADWHHYALVWNPSGIPGILDGTARIAAFVDGKLNTGLWNGIINPRVHWCYLPKDALGFFGNHETCQKEALSLTTSRFGIMPRSILRIGLMKAAADTEGIRRASGSLKI